MLLSLYLRREAKDRYHILIPRPTPELSAVEHTDSRWLPTRHRSIRSDLVILSVNGNVVPKNETVLIYGNLVPTPCTHTYPTS